MTPSGGEPARLLLGNLDCEGDLALLLAARPGARPPRRHPWTRRALARAAGAATLLRVFADPGDRLWVLDPIAPGRLAEVPGLPRPQVLCGPWPEHRLTSGVFAWCETPTVAALRAGGERPAGIDAPASDPMAGLPLCEIVWRLPAAPPEVVAAVNHRSFCLAVQRQLGCALPGACMVGSMAELAAHLAAAAGRGADDCGDWVVKAPLSAAGRARAIVRRTLEPAGLRRPEVRRSVERLLARHGPLLFEPWVPRCSDFGAAGLLLATGLRWIGFHRQRVDERGRFVGVDIRVAGEPGAGRDALPGLFDDPATGVTEPWRRVLDAAAGALHRAGYRGPFGIDAWQYHDAAGVRHFHPLGEINARATFGLVAHALVERLRQPLKLIEGDCLRLVLGEASSEITPATGLVEVVPLLHAADPSGHAAWLEIARSRH